MLLFAAVAALTTVAAAQGQQRPVGSGLSAAQTAAIDRLGQFSVSGRFAPSVVIAVERKGQTVYARGFGYRNVEAQLPALSSTPYLIGSNTKQFAAAAILMLQDQGKLRVDDRLSKYFPAIPHAHEVTLRQLLTMCSGIADYVEVPQLLKIVRRPARSPAQAVALVKDLPLDFRPGTRWQYSNSGYMLLQMLVERLSGMSFHDFLQRRIFARLGMHATYLALSNNLGPTLAGEYSSFAFGPWERAPHWDYSWFGAAGALVSDVSDLEKWNAALDGGKLLSAQSLKEMLAPGPAASTPGGEGYGMGIRAGRMPNGHRFIWHGGNTTGSATQDARFPDDKLSIIVLSNTGYYSYNATVQAIYKIVVPQTPAVNPAKEAPPPPPQADPAKLRAATRWLDDAIAGRIEMGKLNEDVSAVLTPPHRAALRALSQYGSRKYTLVGTDRRRPTTTYFFTVETKKKPFDYQYKWHDDGRIADILILPILEFPKEAIATPSPAPVPDQP
ncbi:MAG: beta-lactamase family protein [Candidatus Eremiobacteraeota bacterium]|nr:beta-lactamase family protein [Candidatus Eremiobacteraeota bacterium]